MAKFWVVPLSHSVSDVYTHRSTDAPKTLETLQNSRRQKGDTEYVPCQGPKNEIPIFIT